MSFNCGIRSVWLPILLPAVAVVLFVPFFISRSKSDPPIEPIPKARPTPPAAVAPPVAPPAPPLAPPPTNSPDPVLRGWQNAIRSRDAKGVLTAQSEFFEREGQYREKLMAMAKEDPDPRIRAFSVAVLGRMKSPPPESYFLERLDDASEYPRVSALEALEKIGTGGCLSKVDGLASSDPAEPARAAAAKAAKAVRSR